MRIYSYNNKPSPAKHNRTKLFGKQYNWKRAFTWAFRLLAVGILLIALLFLYYSKDLPDPNRLLDRTVPESTKIYARDGSLLYEVHGEVKRTLVGTDQISTYLKQATVAIEDRNFYNHGGISVTGIARSAFVDILHAKKTQGASTITQQFVKNAILTKDKSWDRKIKEAILAIAIDARFSKDQILKLYLNEIPYGRNAYGIEAAAQTYFNKSAKDLGLAESAYLAALPQSTTYYNPSGPHRDALEARKNTVLNVMREQGYITEQQAQQAKDEKVNFQSVKTAINAPHFVFYVQDYLASKFGEKTLQEGGLKVYTTLDPNLQKIAEQAVKDGVAKNEKKYNGYNAALVAIDPKTGQILAMVGSKDYFAESVPAGCIPGKNCLFEPNVNVAVSERQPGSSFKPYAYVTAFKKDFKYAPASMLVDVVTNFGTFGGKAYIPQNYSAEQNGPVSMRQALAGSLNIPAVKTLALVGVDNATQTAHDLGITSPLADCGLSLVLGGCEVKLIDHVASYSVFANGGVKNDKTAILKILDKEGKTLEEYKPNPTEELDPQANYELVNIMTDNAARAFVFGANSPLILPGRTVAAKTGTTQKWHDGWTIGFTPSLTAGVWAGNNDGTLLKKGADGVLVAAPIWNQFMKQALASTTPEDFTVPPGIQKVTVDSVSGKLPTEFTPSTKTEVFADYSVPKDYDNIHINIALDADTNQPATALTSPDKIINKVYTVLHSEKPKDPNWEDPVIAWAINHGYQYPPDSGVTMQPSPNNSGPVIAITQPADSSTVPSGPFAVTVSANSNAAMARVDLSIDGQFYQSSTQQPFSFQVNNPLTNGDHTLAAKAVDANGATSDTSITITVGNNTPVISITEPLDNSTSSFPLNISAQSINQFNQVNFYYQGVNGVSKLIGPATNTSHIGDQYQYSTIWHDKPASGNYKIFVQTQTSASSPKIKVIVP